MGITFADFLRERLSLIGADLRPGRALDLVVLALQVRRERAQLAKLSRSELAEMGIDPAAADREGARSLFDLPKSRMEDL